MNLKSSVKFREFNLKHKQSPEFAGVRPKCHRSSCAIQSGELKMETFEKVEVQDRVLAIVKTILGQNSISADVRPESRLVDAGLTSMDMVKLMLDVEAEFDLTIPQGEITPENFQSVKTLELMIISQLRPETAL